MYLLRSPDDHEVGKYIFEVCSNLEVISENIKRLHMRRGELFGKSRNELEFQLDLLSFQDGRKYQILAINPDHNPIISGLQRIRESWEVELNRVLR